LQSKNRERWQALCELAATEQDPDRLMELIHEIEQLLNEKDERLRRKMPQPQSSVMTTGNVQK
jgi:hypothetical protein